MIYTVTFNPSLDYVIQVDKLVPGEINRTTHEAVYPGGKGNNVSVILSNLGHSSKALGFTAGFTGEALENMLKEFGCDTAFIRLPEGSTRINVKINAGEETEINGQGPVITEEAQSALFEQLDALKKKIYSYLQEVFRIHFRLIFMNGFWNIYREEEFILLWMRRRNFS